MPELISETDHSYSIHYTGRIRFSLRAAKPQRLGLGSTA